MVKCQITLSIDIVVVLEEKKTTFHTFKYFDHDFPLLKLLLDPPCPPDFIFPSLPF